LLACWLAGLLVYWPAGPLAASGANFGGFYGVWGMIWVILEGPGWLGGFWLAARAAWAGQAGRWVGCEGPRI